MKILDFKLFEKLNINQINLDTINSIGKRQTNIYDENNPITKNDLQTFDIVTINNKFYILFKYNDLIKLINNAYKGLDDAKEGMFLWYDYDLKHCNILWVSTYSDDLKAFYISDIGKIKRMQEFDITSVWIYESIDTKTFPKVFHKYTQYLLHEIIKDNNYVEIKIKDNIF